MTRVYIGSAAATKRGWGSSAYEPHAAEKMLDTLLEMVAEVRDAK